MKRQELEELVQDLVDSYNIALTTHAKEDKTGAIRVQTAAVRGDHELLCWGVGPKLSRGDIVALYTPESEHLPKTYRKMIRHLYSVATDTIEIEKNSNDPKRPRHLVFLYRRVTIDPPLEFEDLEREIGLHGREIQSAGRRTKPWDRGKSFRFWRYLLQSRPSVADTVKSRMIGADQVDRIAISYAGEDWIQAQRLMLWCEAEDLRAFFVTSVDREVPDYAEKYLKSLLEMTFSKTSVAVFLVPGPDAPLNWIEIEIKAAASDSPDSPDPPQVLLVRTDSDRPWPLPENGRVKHLHFEPGEEANVVKEIRSLLPSDGP